MHYIPGQVAVHYPVNMPDPVHSLIITPAFRRMRTVLIDRCTERRIAPAVTWQSSEEGCWKMKLGV